MAQSAAPATAAPAIAPISLKAHRPLGGLLRHPDAGPAVLRRRRAGRHLRHLRRGRARVGPRRPSPARFPLPLSDAPPVSEGTERTMNSISVRALLVRGMLAGLIAGVLALAVAYFLGESRVDAAIAFEEAARPRPRARRARNSSAAPCSPPAASPPASWSSASRSAASPPSSYCVRARPHRPLRPAGHRRAGRGGGPAHRLRGAVPEVPGEPAGRRQPRHHREAHHPVLPDGRAQRAAGGRRGDPRQAARTAPGQLERDRSRRPPASSWRSASPTPSCPRSTRSARTSRPRLLWKFRLSTLAIQTTLWAGFGLIFGYLAERLLVSGNGADARRVATPVG